MSPEKEPFQTEISSSNHQFLGDVLVFGWCSSFKKIYKSIEDWLITCRPFRGSKNGRLNLHPPFEPVNVLYVWAEKPSKTRPFATKRKRRVIWVPGHFFFGVHNSNSTCGAPNDV